MAEPEYGVGDVVAAYHFGGWCGDHWYGDYAFVRVTGFTPAGNLRLELLESAAGDHLAYNGSAFRTFRPDLAPTGKRLVARRGWGTFQFKFNGDMFRCVERYDPQKTYTENHITCAGNA